MLENALVFVETMHGISPRLTGGMAARVTIMDRETLECAAVYDLMIGKSAAYWSDNKSGGSILPERVAMRALLADRVSFDFE